ncbi:u3 small nucleolar RNA-associated protein 15-like protein [Blastocystis sp. subtype 4]|uniref:u3 small nucleolar RNA-associated protein 15-like protein n=1 Tax=Blastocystis sp. subtype 4 TaxID=944170 RepID=UPI0007119075|nr:u3 small nucleolar RNA-associated protein 15-like protein [Blastocystis sp. subtype 4]KNB41539.1 u3 small nucleolar RNA-associated protein 15-like protein [Blastocystis sp. subtype 4]|eukprot:XP_014524982.1 u3 small nucleolar RNA-associated protein 15-like protein [Blastocystis sp. subtype 4]
MAVGTSSGILSTRVRNEVNTTEEEEQPTILPGAFFARAPAVEKRVRPEIEAKKVEVAAEKRKKLTKWDQYMRKFEYVKALDAVLSSRSVRDIIALIEELHARSDLPIAIKGRSDKELEPLISFVTFYISDPLYTNTLVTVATLILDLYADQVGKSSLIDSQLLKLKQCLDTEIEMQQNVFSVMGMLDSIVANSEN